MKITITVEDESGEVQTYRVSTAVDNLESERSGQSRVEFETDEQGVEIFDAGPAPTGSNGRTSGFESQDGESDAINAGSFR